LLLPFPEEQRPPGLSTKIVRVAYFFVASCPCFWPSSESLGEDQDIWKPVPHASLPLPEPHRVQDVEQNADETALKVAAIPNRLVGDRVELMIRCRPLDLDGDGLVDHDVRSRAAARLFDHDGSTESCLEEAGQFDLVRKLVVILPRWPEFLDGGRQACEVLRQTASG